jgi:hypothetical protein
MGKNNSILPELPKLKGFRHKNLSKIISASERKKLDEELLEMMKQRRRSDRHAGRIHLM